MKQFYAFLVRFFVILFMLAQPMLMKSQCTSPSLHFEQPTLVSGVAGAVDAVYKFTTICPGVDAYITITKIVGGATLSNMDDNTFGYPAAWQPVVKTAGVQSASESYISFRVEFKNPADDLPFFFPCFVMSCIDVDGDNDRVREFVAADGFQSYSVSNTTTLTVTNEGAGLIKAAGTFNNFPGIDTSAYVTNINYKYANAGKINEVRIGNITAETFIDQDRYSCIYFKPISMINYYVLPVDFVNLKVIMKNNSIDLNWTTRTMKEKTNFKVERSFDGVNFSAIGEINTKNLVENNLDHYTYSDKTISNSKQNPIYYRVMQLLPGNKSIYSDMVSIKPQASDASMLDINISPNPFTEKITLVLKSKTCGNAEVRIINMMTGKEMSREVIPLTTAIAAVNLKNVQSIPAGLYAIQVYINGVAACTKKLIKI